ncbi:MAG: DUF503 domain-containing protein [Armatimonadetes bacterium]|nr:DUF503 domain-containing protein [Armatimonadota bacterium]
MVVGLLCIELSLPGANSLKEKRRVLKSLIDRVHNQFNVAAAEVDHQDQWRRATVAVACVSEGSQHASQVLSRVMSAVDRQGGVVVMDYSIQMR